MYSWLAKVAHKRSLDARRRVRRKSMASVDAVGAESMDRTAVDGSAAAERCEGVSALLARLRREEPENCWLLCEHHLQKNNNFASSNASALGLTTQENDPNDIYELKYH
jgi:hypothetical protein